MNSRDLYPSRFVEARYFPCSTSSQHLVVLILPLLTLVWIIGCSADKTPPSNTTTQPAATQPVAENPAEPTPPPEPPPILPESEKWTQEEAVAELAEEPTRLSAAVRLLQLSDLDPFGIPTPWPMEFAKHLRVVPLAESRWALGLQADDDHVIAAPVLIDSEGAVAYPVENLEPLFTFLHSSDDAESFPHLLFAGDRAWIWSDGEWISTLCVKKPSGLHFERRLFKRRPTIALLFPQPPAADADPTASRQYAEVAHYSWDPFEIAFAGPLCDKLPDPPGGQFELDLKCSVALIPVGGLLPEAPKIEPRPDVPIEKRPPPY